MSELLDYGRAGRTLALPDIIDMHAHFGNWSWHIPDTTAGGLVAVMDRVGVRSIPDSARTQQRLRGYRREWCGARTGGTCRGGHRRGQDRLGIRCVLLRFAAAGWQSTRRENLRRG